MKQTNIKKEWILVLFFGLLFAAGMVGVKDYGISYDEVIERNSSLITYKYIIGGVQETVTDTVNFPALAELPQYVDRYYGVALQEIPVAAEHLFGFHLSYRSIFLMRHFFTFCVFFAGLVFFYFFLKECGIRRRYCCLGVFMLFLSPRIFADACYNIKDLPFLSMTILTLFYCLRFIRRGKITEGFLWCLTGALCANIRIVGAVFFVIGELLFLIYGKQKKLLNKLCLAAVCGIGCMLLYILLMPALWENPVQNTLELLRSFSDFSRWGGANYYLGQWYPEGTEPWHYLFVWIFATTPVIYSVCFVGGAVCAVKKTIQQDPCCSLPVILCGLCILIPVLYLLIGHPVVYNGWRHFFFLYPLLLYFAVFFVNEMEQRFAHSRIWRFALAAGLGGSFLTTGVWMAQNHPYEYVYFNPLIREYAWENLEKDYWAVSEYELMKEILARDSSDSISVCALSGSGTGWYRMPDWERNRIQMIKTANVPIADYVIQTHTAGQESFSSAYLFQKVKDLTVDGAVISSLFQRTRLICGEYTFQFWQKSGQVSCAYNLSNAVWKLSQNGEEMILESGRIKKTNEAALQMLVVDKGLYETLSAVQIWSDTQEWSFDPAEFSACKDEFVLELPQECENSVQIRLVLQREKMQWAEGEACYAVKLAAGHKEADLIPKGLLSHLDSVSTNYNESEISRILDDNRKTRWTSQVAQTEGMYITAALKEKEVLAGAKLLLGDSPWDYPVHLRILISENGTDWQEIEYRTKDSESYWFDAVVSQYIRFELGKAEEEISSNWSVYELELYTQPAKE